MSRARSSGPPLRPRNWILAALKPPELRRMSEALDPVNLVLKDELYRPGEPITHVYFLETAVASLVQDLADGKTIEAATVGREGIVGLPVFLGAASAAGRAVIQVPGEALRIKTTAFRVEVDRGGSLQRLLQRYTQALFNQLSQSVACNRAHPAHQRCARWMLMTHDRVDGDRFPLTQEFLAQMLGVRRATVSELAGELQRQGIIEYERGSMHVLDRAGLEAASCECYGIVTAHMKRLLG